MSKAGKNTFAHEVFLLSAYLKACIDALTLEERNKILFSGRKTLLVITKNKIEGLEQTPGHKF